MWQLEFYPIATIKQKSHEIITDITFTEKYEYQVIRSIFHYKFSGVISHVTLKFEIKENLRQIGDNIFSINNVDNIKSLLRVSKLNSLLHFLYPNVRYSLKIESELKSILLFLGENYLKNIESIKISSEYLLNKFEEYDLLIDFSKEYSMCQVIIVLEILRICS